ncbi:MAG: hypothetical protein CMJ48_08495 [Planctomycetaceae bacterium]|nr:hypothetical protein [Planctomycetaceae bacterium]
MEDHLPGAEHWLSIARYRNVTTEMVYMGSLFRPRRDGDDCQTPSSFTVHRLSNGTICFESKFLVGVTRDTMTNSHTTRQSSDRADDIAGAREDGRGRSVVSAEAVNEGRRGRLRTSHAVGLLLLLTAGVFWIDTVTPLGVAGAAGVMGGVPYVLVVLASLWILQREYALIMAALCTLLLIAGFFVSPAGGELWQVAMNRSFAVFAIWTTALLGAAAKHSSSLAAVNAALSAQETATRKQAEEALHVSEEHWRSLTEYSPDHIMLIDEELKIQYINRPVSGLTVDDVIGAPLLDFVPPKCHEDVVNCFAGVFAAGEPGQYETTYCSDDGTERVFEAFVGPIVKSGKVTAATCRATDITDRRRTEEALRESEEMHRVTLTNISDTVLITDDAGDYTFICPNAHIIFDYSEEEIRRTKNISALLGEGLFDPGQLRARGELTNIECEVRDRRGDPHALLINVKHVSIKGGTTLYSCRDVTARKRAQAELRLRNLAIESARNGILIADACSDDMPIVYVNPAFERMTGYSAKDVFGKNARYLHGSDRDQPELAEVRRALRESRDVHVTLRNYRKDGTLFWNDLSISPVRSDDGRITHFIGVQNDVTEQKASERELRENEQRLTHVARLSTMGAMVAGISHELGQPLYAITNYSDACATAAEQLQGGQGEQVVDWIRRISEQANIAGTILKRLRDFTRPSRAERMEADLNSIVRQSIESTALELRDRNVRIELQLTEPLPRLFVDRVQILQVMINLLRNSWEAMEETAEDERRIEICTQATETDETVIVRDSGPGFGKEGEQRLFDQFYSTKAAGMGLGLAISRSIIESHQGRLWSTSTDVGAVFSFALPIGCNSLLETDP